MSDRKLLKKVRDGDKEALSDIIKIWTFSVSVFTIFTELKKIL